MTSSPQVLTNPPFRFRDTVLRFLDRADRHGALLLAFVLLFDIVVALRSSLDLPLWHDELFTYTIAQAPTLHELMRESTTADLNPPLSYLLTRLSFHTFGVGTLQCRLPEILGFLLALFATFFFVRRRAGNSTAVLASAILLASAAGKETIQARPYGLMLGFTMLALLAWQSSSVAEEEGRPSWGYDLLLMVALALLLLSHVFGLLSWATVAIAELIAAKQRHRISLLRTLALLPPLAVTWLYKPLLLSHGVTEYPRAFQPDLPTIIRYYISTMGLGLIALWLAAVLLALLGKRDWFRGSVAFPFTVPEWVAGFAFFSLPCVLMLRLMLQHAAFFDRYGLLVCVGVSLLFAATFHWSSGGRPAAALLGAAVVLTLGGRLFYVVGAAAHALLHSKPAVLARLDPMPDPSLPIVDASGLTFVEMNHYESAQVLSHTWYLTGGEFAVEYAHATIFEAMPLEKQLFHFQANVESYQNFTTAHKHFYVVGIVDYPEEWLLRKLLADGATLILRKQNEAYHGGAVYEVTMPN